MTRLDRDQAVASLRRGDVVALPSDTVYGVGASLAHPAAVARLFTLKGRPTTVALPVIVAGAADVAALGVNWTDRAVRLADAFWPGALTIVVDAPRDLARVVGSQGGVGLRLPDDDVLVDVVRRVGPIALTSANRHGEPPCTSADAVLESFAESRDLAGVLDAGVRHAVVSSVVDVTEPTWRLVRAGAVSVDELVAVLGSLA